MIPYFFSVHSLIKNVSFSGSGDSPASQRLTACSNPASRPEDRYTTQADRYTSQANRYTVLQENAVPDIFRQYRRTGRAEARGGAGDTFNKMSDEVVLHVFKWLPKTSLAR